MKLTKLFIAIIIVAVIAIFASACTGEPNSPESEPLPVDPNANPEDTIDPETVELESPEDSAPAKVVELPEEKDVSGLLPRDMEGDMPEEIAESVIATASESYSVLPEEVKIVSSEGVTWTDGCLGLGQKDESCLNAMVNGWRVEMEVSGETIFARTDHTGTAIRFEDSNSTVAYDKDSGAPPPAVLKAISVLSEMTDIKGKPVTVVSWASVEWPDGCLGLEKSDEMCTQALVPGYKVELKVGEKVYIAHTDASGFNIRFEE